MIDYLNEVMRHSAGLIKDHIHAGKIDNDLGKAIKALNYADPEKSDFKYEDPLHNAVYFVKYGYAYAFEYAFIYEMILMDYKSRDDVFGVTTIGCGSCLDAWSLAYAKSQINKNVSLRYAGNDLAAWGIMMKPEKGNALDRAYQREDGSVGMRYPGIEGMQCDFLDFLRTEDYSHKYNAIMFSKILNELTDQERDDLIGVFRENAGRFKPDRPYYICISHSIDKYKKMPQMKTIAQKIVAAINYDNRFRVDDSLAGKYQMLQDISGPDDLACYEFKKNKNGYNDKIEFLNEDFTPVDEVSEVREFIDGYKYIDYKINIFGIPSKRPSDKVKYVHKCVVNTSTSLFQIIKLEPVSN